MQSGFSVDEALSQYLKSWGIIDNNDVKKHTAKQAVPYVDYTPLPKSSDGIVYGTLPFIDM
jgi:hypothetical protein